MANISEIKNLNDNGDYTVGVNADGETKIFVNRDDEYILNERYCVISRAKSLKEAEVAEKKKYKNTCFCVVVVNYNGVAKIKILKRVGVMNNAPIGTVAICKRRRDAKRHMNKLRRENENIEVLVKTA